MLNLTGNYIFQRIDIAVFGSDAVSTAIIVAQKSFDEIAQRLVENFYCSTMKVKRILEQSIRPNLNYNCLPSVHLPQNMKYKNVPV